MSRREIILTRYGMTGAFLFLGACFVALAGYGFWGAFTVDDTFKQAMITLVSGAALVIGPIVCVSFAKDVWKTTGQWLAQDRWWDNL